MTNRFASMLDFHLTYQMMIGLFFAVISFLLYLGFEPGVVPVIPNLILLISLILSTFLLTILSQIIHPVKYSKRWLLVRQGLAIIPPLLATVLIVRWAKTQKRESNDRIFYFGGLFLAIIASFISLMFAIVLLLAFVIDPIPGHGYYLASIGIWGMLGITLADTNIFYNSHISSEIHESRLRKFSKKSSEIFTKLFFNRRRRITIFTIVISFFLMIMLISNSINLNPIGYDYLIDDEERSGNLLEINNVEMLADDLIRLFDLEMDRDITQAPLLLGLSIIEKHKQMVKDEFGTFAYIAEGIGLNTTIDSLLLDTNKIIDPLLGYRKAIGQNEFDGVNSIVYQVLKHPFKSNSYVRNTVLLENSIPVLWLIQLVNWN